jgi:hypothetical protein
MRRKLFIALVVCLSVVAIAFAADRFSGIIVDYTDTPTADRPTYDVEFEGDTADAYETFFDVTDPTADAVITIPNSTGTMALLTGTGSYKTVVAKTADYSVTAADSGKVFTITGTAANVEFDLPATPSAGANYLFVHTHSGATPYSLTVDPGATERIIGLADSVGDSVVTGSIGATLQVTAVAYTGTVMSWAVSSSYSGWADND